MIPARQEWMQEEARVMVLGKSGIIVKVHSHNFSGAECVSLIDVRIDGSDEVQSYHPSDVSPYGAGTQVKIQNQ